MSAGRQVQQCRGDGIQVRPPAGEVKIPASRQNSRCEFRNAVSDPEVEGRWYMFLQETNENLEVRQIMAGR